MKTKMKMKHSLERQKIRLVNKILVRRQMEIITFSPPPTTTQMSLKMMMTQTSQRNKKSLQSQMIQSLKRKSPSIGSMDSTPKFRGLNRNTSANYLMLSSTSRAGTTLLNKLLPILNTETLLIYH